MSNKIITLAISLAIAVTALADSIPTSDFAKAPVWRIGTEVSACWVPPTNGFLEGDNSSGKDINTSLSGDLRAAFTYNPATRTGILYHDVYQGVGVGVRTFFACKDLGTPVSAYVFQGAPITHFTGRLCLGYEWRFGAAFGWKHYDAENAPTNAVIGTSTTAHMALALKLNYRISDRWHLSVGLTASHFSNGNTAYPNSGVNTLGATIGMSYILNPQGPAQQAPAWLLQEADRPHWFMDIMTFGAWRKRIVKDSDGFPTLCPGRFGVVGLQVAPMRQFNRYLAAGMALDAQWDESAGLAPYRVDGSSGDDIKFFRPPFGKQLNIGLSAHAELIMPIFTVNVGIGYDIVSPKGEDAFYQMLTLKTFVTKRLYINTGYRLSSFKNPQNLMLGLGFRL